MWIIRCKTDEYWDPVGLDCGIKFNKINKNIFAIINKLDAKKSYGQTCSNDYECKLGYFLFIS